ncbi:MAG TPA: hypothetical protein VFA59_05315 [Vicinamibacterales bacterium]|nr:hypothetical protein [Vicinamibacterales bacterium]
MAETQRTDKPLKKDPNVARDAHEELQEEIRSGGTKPLEPNINRDRARGDWDRSGKDSQ